jgi:hypothetical protein
MFTPLFLIGLLCLMAGLFGSRYLAERSLKLLSPEEKLKLLDAFSGMRLFAGLPMIAVALLFVGITYVSPQWFWSAYFTGLALFAVYFTVMHQLVYRKMAALGINAQFQAAHRKARWLAYGGFAAFFALNTLSPFLSR